MAGTQWKSTTKFLLQVRGKNSGVGMRRHSRSIADNLLDFFAILHGKDGIFVDFASLHLVGNLCTRQPHEPSHPRPSNVIYEGLSRMNGTIGPSIHDLGATLESPFLHACAGRSTSHPIGTFQRNMAPTNGRAER